LSIPNEEELSLTGLSNLRSLSLTFAPKLIDLPHLKNLDIVPVNPGRYEYISNLTSLRSLSIYSKSDKDNVAISNLTNLRQLYLSCTFSDKFITLTQLKCLSLKCKDSFPNFISALTNLSTLSINSGGHMLGIPEFIVGMSKLKNIHVDYAEPLSLNIQRVYHERGHTLVRK